MRRAHIALLFVAASVNAANPNQLNFTNVQLWPCNSSNPDQQWIVKPPADPSVPATRHIVSATSGLCLDILDYGTSDGSNIQTYSCHPSDTDPAHQNQYWAQVQAAGGAAQFRANMSNKCIVVDPDDVTGSTAEAGANVVLGECTDAAANWTVEGGLLRSTLQNEQGLPLCLDSGTNYGRPCIPPYDAFPFCNASLGIAERVADLISRINVSDYPGQFDNTANGISYLGIPRYEWWDEATHGVGYSPGVKFSPPTPNATSFPEPILTAAAFNTSLFQAIGGAVSDEASAFINVGHASYTYWAPNINLARDPRWGRIQETPGEDPYLSGQWAIHYVRGLQEGDDPRFVKVSADCKHFAAYDMENSDGYTRHNFPANVSAQDLHDSYLPHFQDCVETGRVTSVMGSYNAMRIVGRDSVAIPSNANPYLLTEVLRNAWGFAPFQYVTSDCGAVSDVINQHHYTDTSDETNKVVLEAGMSVDCGSYMKDSLGQAIQDGAVSKELAQRALTDLFGMRMKLGQFDPVGDQVYRHIGLDVIASPAHQELALDAARQGIVLLKGGAGGPSPSVLPLSASSLSNIAVIGPNANATDSMLGNYAGAAFRLVSPSDGIAGYVPSLLQAAGCSDTKCADSSGFGAATAVAAKADAVVMVIGDDENICGEGHDRTDITLPGVQADLVTKVAAAAKGADPAKPVVVVIMSGESVDVSAASADPNVDAILWMGYPGMLGGQAMADVLFGAAVPAGRLPIGFYPQGFTSQVKMINMYFRPGMCDDGSQPCTNPGHTHRFYTGQAVFAFGHGLSYTTFEYQWTNGSLPVSASASALRAMTKGAPSLSHLPAIDDVLGFVNFEVTVTNTGKVDADDSVLCFVEPPDAGKDGNPLQVLAGFERVHLKAGESRQIVFAPSARHFVLADQDGAPRVVEGVWTVRVGVKDANYLKLGGTPSVSRTVLVE